LPAPKDLKDFSKEPRLRRDGVSTYLALIFGTLLSSQGADASFVPVSGPSGRFLRFQLYHIHFRSVSGLDLNPVGRWSGLLPFGVFTTLADFPGDS
ncbi:hypothetical protein, partial [Streptomyces bambusae]|uniref:hypothetical protein n=1 Tax=Streptomyces bambusae TaxID=1550616 RepID=UPI001CA4B561